MKPTIILPVILLGLSTPAMAWDGEDSETGEAVEIESGNLVRSGRDIEIYDSGDGSYHDVTVEDINRSGGSVDVEIYDNNTGEYRTLEMEGE